MRRDRDTSSDTKLLSKADLAADNIALRTQLKFNQTLLDAEEAKTAKLKEILKVKEEQIGWLVKPLLLGPAFERRSWEW